MMPYLLEREPASAVGETAYTWSRSRAWSSRIETHFGTKYLVWVEVQLCHL
jgi:hypothetical protein